MLAAIRAKLLQLQPFRGGLLVLGGRIIPVLTFRALERDDFPRHCKLPFFVLLCPHDSSRTARAHMQTGDLQTARNVPVSKA